MKSKIFNKLKLLPGVQDVPNWLILILMSISRFHGQKLTSVSRAYFIIKMSIVANYILIFLVVAEMYTKNDICRCNKFFIFFTNVKNFPQTIFYIVLVNKNIYHHYLKLSLKCYKKFNLWYIKLSLTERVTIFLQKFKIYNIVFYETSEK